MNLRIAILLAALPLAACQTFASVDPEPFGSAVRNMQYEQTYDPRAASQPPANAPDVTDGERAAQVLRTYRGGGGLSAEPQPEPVSLQEP